MVRRTTPGERREFYKRHLQGEAYQEIGGDTGYSVWCVRHWCRHQRDGGSPWTGYRREPAGLLSRSDPKVRYCVLRLRLEHPRWGPNRIREGLKKRPSLKGLVLPSEASIGRYLHQWSRFRRKPKKRVKRERPKQPTRVHQRWQVDVKMGMALNDGTLVNLCTIRDPVGAACIGAFVFPAGQVGQHPKRASLQQARWALRQCFARWQTLPEEVQTDGDSVLVGQPQDPFPSTFTLWLKGLGVEHLVTRPGKPTDNAEVERCHRTVNDYAIVGNEKANIDHLQSILDQAVYELNCELPSRAKDCNGRPPTKAHPELLQPRRTFRLTHELALFDLNRVDAYLATLTWQRKVTAVGVVTLGGQHRHYSVGRAFAHRQVLVRFDPADRHFVFYDLNDPETELGRRPAKNLDVAFLTGLTTEPDNMESQQLPLPLAA
jgi:transposase InsO family protein